ncbi:hypothetical protein GWI33_017031 [Rhynchophorus ferrugineus]|uniref:Uncharacterized protein n=1 Tax=Rhynchophorus ferrugineus TaxID=354439 RepID=A0A834M819_RHYFE|nr:hypothetical protein GWI33_017031 [Rhynchophorus ferrugineus]
MHLGHVHSILFILNALFTTVLLQTDTENCNSGKIRTAGTGTVLFNPTDVYKTCWSQDELSIITARMIMEDVIPDPRIISIQCNDDITDIIDYFKAVIEFIRGSTKGRKKHILLMALTDLLGGYLHYAILPMSRKAYYAGAVEFTYMEKLIQLYEEVKWFLRTNGQGWTKPMLITKEVSVPVIDIEKEFNAENTNSCCSRLLFYEHEPLKSKTKRSATTEKGFYFPLPFFDAKHSPKAIVVPLKHYAVRSIESRRAAYIIMKYFVTAERCLHDSKAKQDQVQKFQNNLYTWIEHDVIPKLGDDRFYAAFGGAVRVWNTLKVLGARVGEVSCNTDENEEEMAAVPGAGCSSRRTNLFIVAMLVIIFAWFVIGTCFICYRMRNSKKTKTHHDDTNKKSSSSGSLSSSKFSSFLSKSSSKSSKEQYCKCCEYTVSEKSVADTSTSEYDTEKTKKKPKRKLLDAINKRNTKSSPCVCTGDGPATIEPQQSVKVLPSIEEISEQSQNKERKPSLKRISFAQDSSLSSSDSGAKVCVPPWVKVKNTIPCPILVDKTTSYVTSKSNTAKSQTVPENVANESTATNEPVATQSTPTDKPENNLESVTPEEKTETLTTPSNQSIEKPSETVEESSNVEDEQKSTPPTDPLEKTYENYHMAACHSSMSGSYDLFHGQGYTKPYIFGYDFQTSTSSDLSDDD